MDVTDSEIDPLMDEKSGIRNTTQQFLRSFSILSDDSDFDELDEPDTPGDYLDGGGDTDVDTCVRHTTTSGIRFESGTKPPEPDGKLIPFSSIHKPYKGFTHIRPDCWMRDPVTVTITDVYREDHPHMTRKAFNPNLYTIKVTHGEYSWTVKRRYKHFDSLHKSLRLFRARYVVPMPTKQHRERRQSMREERKERKIKKKQEKKPSRFPKKPEIMVRGDALEKRKNHLQQYLQNILKSKWYRNHTEVLKFLEVSELSFVNRLGQKWKEGDVNKCSGGRRISIGCCGCLKKYHVAGRWSKRWLVVKDTFIAYIRPSDGVLCDLMLMDSQFRVESGMSATGAPHGLLVMNLTRHLLAKCWTSRKADEWEESIKTAASTTGREFTADDIRYKSYAPVRENSYARWFVDGSSYFEAVADALEKAKEEIFITDWWLSPEIYLKRHVTDRERWRLDVILGRKAKEGVKVFIILYKELEIALTINSRYSKHALMNKSENIKVIRHPDHVAGTNRVLLWAHHEKMVVIDQKTAFLGGLDLCYGRWDDDQHRMTDLGSVTFKPLSESTTDPVAPNGRVNHQKVGPKRSKNIPRQPSTILESPEHNMADSGIDDWTGTQPKGSNEDVSQPTTGSVENVTGSHSDHIVTDVANQRHSLCSEGDFGSNDILTNNDSLETVNKEGYHNVVAEVTVHTDHVVANNGEHVNYEEGKGEIEPVHKDRGEKNSEKCNNNDKTAGSISNNDAQSIHDLPHVSGEEAVKLSEGEMVKLERETSEVSHSVEMDDIELTDGAGNVQEVVCDVEKIEKQIITSDKASYLEGVSDRTIAQDIPSVSNNTNAELSVNDCVQQDVVSQTTTHSNGAKNTDLNKNQTKGSVTFKQDSEIKEEHIVPTEAVPIEGSPPAKKDAATKRETWASRKLRKRFGFRGDKYEEEDQVDGKEKDKGDKSDKSDSDEESGGARFRNKWRMVLNIKKLEHAGKKVEDEDELPPRSPYMKHAIQSPHHPSLSTRIRQSMPFRHQRQDSDDDFYYNLYPFKRLFRREDSTSVTVKSVMKTSVADDYEGLEGSSKFWIGKDYVNFIHKDPIDVHNPFEDFIERDKTPRMPWHDIGGVVYGKAARDVARHFIQRWNFCKSEKFKTKKEFPILMPKSYAKCEVAPSIKDITYNCTTQILRSVCGWSAGIKDVEDSIHTAYIDCINNAKHYIYIENQFFISQYGDHSHVRNKISEALVNRIERAYKEKEMFRVYVVLPLLPAFEGEIGANGGYAIQAVLHWNYKSISKGEHSLWTQLQKKVDDPKKYILFCGLRTHAELKGKLVTELVYVHSKLMIVDDDTVIIGSANINDRSMVGTRDSEMAVIVQDTNKFPVKMAGQDHMAGSFAASLRRTLFREHLGIGERDFEIDLSDPVCDEFYKNVWFHRAALNTTIYHKVFKCIPDDRVKTFSQIPEMSESPLVETDPELARQELDKVQGRVVLMPLYFLEFEETIMAGGANKEAVMPMKLWL